jgi:hypothetical protein
VVSLGPKERDAVRVEGQEQTSLLRDLDLEEDCPSLRDASYKVTSPRDPRYNCIAFAVGDLQQFWDDVRIRGRQVRGYYWPPGAGSIETLEGWMSIFKIHGYTETEDRTLELEYEKIAIYAGPDGPEHVARQKASGIWTSKMGKGVDIQHDTLESLEGDFYGKVVKIMKRKCQGGKRVLE